MHRQRELVHSRFLPRSLSPPLAVLMSLFRPCSAPPTHAFASLPNLWFRTIRWNDPVCMFADERSNTCCRSLRWRYNIKFMKSEHLEIWSGHIFVFGKYDRVITKSATGNGHHPAKHCFLWSSVSNSWVICCSWGRLTLPKKNAFDGHMACC